MVAPVGTLPPLPEGKNTRSSYLIQQPASAKLPQSNCKDKLIFETKTEALRSLNLKTSRPQNLIIKMEKW